MWSFLSFFRGHFYFWHNSNIWRVGLFKLSYWIVHDQDGHEGIFRIDNTRKTWEYGTLKNMGEPKMKFENFFKKNDDFKHSFLIVFTIFWSSQQLKGRSLQLWTRVYPAVSRVDFFKVGLVIFPSFLKKKKDENKNVQNMMKRSKSHYWWHEHYEKINMKKFLWSFSSFFRGLFCLRHNLNIGKLGSFKLSSEIELGQSVPTAYYSLTLPPNFLVTKLWILAKNRNEVSGRDRLDFG